MDASIRRLERLARAGDRESEARLEHVVARMGHVQTCATLGQALTDLTRHGSPREVLEVALGIWGRESRLADHAERVLLGALEERVRELWGSGPLAALAIARSHDRLPWQRRGWRPRIRDLLRINKLPRGASALEDLQDSREARRGLDPLEVARPDRLAARRMAAERARAATTRRAVLEAYGRCGYRRSTSGWAGGDHEVTISFGAPGATGASKKVWSSNMRWSGTDSRHQITVRATWCYRVPRAIRVVAGRLTLDARRVGPGRWAAVRAVPGRGFGLRAECGYIIACDGEPEWRRT